MNKTYFNKGLAVGIVFLFIVTVFTPAVLSYDEPVKQDLYMDYLIKVLMEF